MYVFYTLLNVSSENSSETWYDTNAPPCTIQSVFNWHPIYKYFLCTCLAVCLSIYLHHERSKHETLFSVIVLTLPFLQWLLRFLYHRIQEWILHCLLHGIMTYYLRHISRHKIVSAIRLSAVENDRIQECIRQNRLFATFTESGPMFAISNSYWEFL